MSVNWLITGGCGFIGTSLIRDLINDAGHSIRVIDNLSVGTLEDLQEVAQVQKTKASDVKPMQEGGALGFCELVIGDILDEELALQVCAGADVIVHLAANTGVGPSVDDPRADCFANVLGTFNYLEAARINDVSRFIFASSGAPAGEVEPPIHEELPPHPVSPYGASKLAGEGYCSAYNRTFGIDTVALRFGNVYGPGSLHKNSVVAKFIRLAMQGGVLEIYGDGTQTRDFIYIEDLIDAIKRASVKVGIGGEAFQIASSHETTVGEMTLQLESILRDSGISGFQVINGETRLGDVKRNFADTSKARGQLGWSPKLTLDEGLKQTVSYFLNNRISR